CYGARPKACAGGSADPLPSAKALRTADPSVLVMRERCRRLVRAEGLEPPQLSSLEPKSSASTSSATPASAVDLTFASASPRVPHSECQIQNRTRRLCLLVFLRV